MRTTRVASQSGLFSNDGVFVRSRASQTARAVVVADTDVSALKAKGVVFEDYEGSVNHVLEFGPTKLAWFKDPDGNLVALSEDDRLT